VKNTFRFLVIAVGVAFYCAATRTSPAVPANPDFSGNASQEVRFTQIAKAPIYHTSPSERSVKTLGSGGASSTVKTTPGSSGAVIRTAEQRYASAFAQYVCISREFLIQVRKADLIFPFHYFW